MQTLSLIHIRKIFQVNENYLEIKIPDSIKTSGPNKKDANPLRLSIVLFHHMHRN